MALLLGGFSCSGSAKPKTPDVVPTADRQLSNDEVRELREELPIEYRRWLQKVEPIMNRTELETFLLLEPWDRDGFVERFWKIRGGQVARDAIDARYDWARDHFHGRLDKAGEALEAVLFFGVPAFTKEIHCSDKTVDIELWFYPRINQLKMNDVTLVIYRDGFNRWKIWRPVEGLGVLMKDPRLADTSQKPLGRTGAGGADIEALYQYCGPTVQELLQAVNIHTAALGGLMADFRISEALSPPEVSSEKVRSVLQSSTTLDKGAADLPIEQITVHYSDPSDLGQKLVGKVRLDVSAVLEAEALQAYTLKDYSLYNVRIIAKIVENPTRRDARVVEEFVSLFTYGADCEGVLTLVLDNKTLHAPCVVESVGVPVTFGVNLAEGDYLLVAKIVDIRGTAQARIERRLVVPRREQLEKFTTIAEATQELRELAESRRATTMEEDEDASTVPSDTWTWRVPELPPANVTPVTEEEAAQVRTSTEDATDSFHVVIIPPAYNVLTGDQRFYVNTSNQVKRVEFLLDGVVVFARNNPPWEASFPVGRTPEPHTLVVRGYDDTGTLLGEDELAINQPADIAVQIVSPPPGAQEVSGPTLIQAQVRTGSSHSISRVDFYYNNELRETRTSPPWQATVDVPELPPGEAEKGALQYLRTVAVLDSGVATEAVRYLNAPEGFGEEVSVDVVELYASITKNGHHVKDLSKDDFTVRDSGVYEEIQSVKFVEELPIHLGIAIDTSTSMQPKLTQAVTAAANFAETMVGERDRAFTLAFESKPRLLQDFTNDPDRLIGSMALLHAYGGTAFYDAVAYSLHRFTGVSGVKALVVLTDGHDGNSRGFDFDRVHDYARRAGVIVYTIGLREGANDPDLNSERERELRKLAEATGGRTYVVDELSDLESVYGQIENELRSRYEIVYLPDSDDSGWHEVELEVDGRGYKVRVRPGYYR